MIFWFVASLGAASLLQASEPGDASSLSGRTYSAFIAELESRRGKTFAPEQKTEWRRDWLNRFLEVLRQTDDRDEQRTIAGAALGLANGVGDFGESERLLEVLVQLDEGSERSAEWLAELGGLRERAVVARGKKPSELQLARRAYDETLTILLNVKAKGQLSPSGFNRLVRTFLDAGIAAAKQGTSQEMTDAKQASLTEGMSYFKRGFEAYSELASRVAQSAQPQALHEDEGPTFAEVLRELDDTPIDGQEFLVRQLSICALLKDDDTAFEVLERIGDQQKLRRRLAEHVAQYASSAHGLDSEAYCDTLSRWIDRSPLTYDSLIVRTILAQSLLHRQRFAEAASAADPVYIDSASVEILSKNETLPFIERKGGTMADAMVVAAHSYHSLKDVAKTESVVERFVRFFNQDERVGEMKLLLEPAHRQPLPAVRSRIGIWFMMANVALLAIVFMVFQWKKNRAVGQSEANSKDGNDAAL